ncbi:MAG: polyprenyl synthetase family protein, partial [Bacillota bacterium]
IPYNRRLLLLPHCLSDRAACAGTYDSIGLHCAGCGSCTIGDLKAQAERLGYQVIVAEGTSSVLMKILDGQVDAIIGVACLDSLEKSFHRIVELGIPHLAVPLLKDGCADTKVEIDQIKSLLHSRAETPCSHTRSYVPLLRETTRVFQEPLFSELLVPCMGGTGSTAVHEPEALGMVPRAAIEWLRNGGKRLRPFVTVATYAVAAHGVAVLQSTADVSKIISHAVRRISLAIEALHKASLVHDDIEDDDEFRYGQQTLHRVHGIGPAVNVGDYLIGLGYRLIAGQTEAVGAQRVGDILGRLSQAHLELCRGQGAELIWQKQPTEMHPPMDVLTIYALKTAPAFEAALYAGLRAAGLTPKDDLLRQFSCYLGEGFQIMNDLEDWRADDRNKLTRGRDALLGRPTVLRAFAAEADGGRTLTELARAHHLAPSDLVNRLGEFYAESGAFAKTERLLDKLRQRAMNAAAGFDTPDLQELMSFLIRLVLPDKAHSSSAATR